MITEFQNPNCAAVILAGGDSVRLSSFTRQVCGYHLPKQFWQLFEGRTLLDQTMRRVSLLVPPSRTITVLNRAHERFYFPLLEGTASRNLVLQPENRGTAPAILWGLLRLVATEPLGPVVIFPSDHYVSDDALFMRHVATALRAVELAPQLIVLLGIAPDGPETEYGWIEPGTPVAASDSALEQIRHVRRFFEKPSPGVARDLYERNYLWNSFILVARASTLLSLIAKAMPQLYSAFAAIRSVRGGGAEEEILRTIYEELPSVDFSGRVLAMFSTELAVLPVSGVGWSDLDDLDRLLTAISRAAGAFKEEAQAALLQFQVVKNESVGRKPLR